MQVDEFSNNFMCMGKSDMLIDYCECLVDYDGSYNIHVFIILKVKSHPAVLEEASQTALDFLETGHYKKH